MIALFLLLFALPAFAADTGTIFGTVVHPEGGPAKQANILVERTNFATQADDQGRFRLEGVPVGAQTIRIFAIGHEVAKRVILVQPGDNPLSEIRTGPKKTAKPVLIQREKAPPELAPDALRVEIVPRDAEHKVYETVRFTIRIHNRSDHPVLLLRAPPDPDEGPQAEFAVAAPFESFRMTPDHRKTDEAASWTSHFVEVKPGDWFDPYGETRILSGVPTRPGTYTATFRYSTKGVGLYTRSLDHEALRLRLEQVPAVDITGKLSFKVDH